MQKIEGKQIYLRPITMEDTDRIVSWRNQDRVRHNFIYQKLFTKESHENWMHTQVETGHVVQFIICEKNNDRPVGSVYFRDIDHDNKKRNMEFYRRSGRCGQRNRIGNSPPCSRLRAGCAKAPQADAARVRG